MGRIVAVLIALLALVVVHRYALGIGTLMYALWGVSSWLYARLRHRGMLGGLSRPPSANGRSPIS
jgi:hypothetical protein